MIKLIKNEIIKFGFIKIILIQILFIFIAILFYKFDYDVSIIYKYIPFVSIFSSIFFSGSINSEIDNGTFRYYLTKPYKRWKVYLSKCIFILIFNIIILLTILLISSILYIDINIEKYIIYSIPSILTSSLIVFNSTIIKNTSICVGINIFLLIFGIAVSQILFGLNFTYVEYTFLPYFDFSIFDDMSVINSINFEFNVNLSIRNGIIINIVYSVIFYIIGNFIFIKKDIKN